jgi:UTP-glucose-1-phosphate uridylyltransferase
MLSDNKTIKTKEVKKEEPAGLGHQVLDDTKVMGGKKPAILLTGATHARELISTTLTLYQMLNLIQKAVIYKEPKY